MPFPSSSYPHVTWNEPHLKQAPKEADTNVASGVTCSFSLHFIYAADLNLFPHRRCRAAGVRGSNLDAVVRPQIKPPPHL
jgi:hypothetical protein